MNKIRATLALLGTCLAAPAHAGPYTDDLSKCLVDSTSQEDRTALVRWMFVAASAHPAVASIAAVSPQELDAANAKAGGLFMRLLTESCVESSRKAVKYEGPAAIQTSFGVLGQVAASELFSSPEVNAAMAGLEKYVDNDKLSALAK